MNAETIRLECPKCHAAFRVKRQALGEAGRVVRCSQCKNEWFAEPPEPPQSETSPFPTLPDMGTSLVGEGLAEAFSFTPDAEAPLPPEVTPPAGQDEPEQDTHRELSAEEANTLERLSKALEETQSQNPARKSKTTPKIAHADMDAPAVSLSRQRWWLVGTVAACFVLSFSVLFTLLQRDRLDADGWVRQAIGADNTQGLVFHRMFIQKLPIGLDKTRYALRGTVTNHASEPRKAPLVRIDLVNKDGEVVKSWPFPEDHRILKAGESLSFNPTSLDSYDSDHAYAFEVSMGNRFEMELR